MSGLLNNWQQSAMEGIFTPLKLVNMTNQIFVAILFLKNHFTSTSLLLALCQTV